MDTFYWRQCQAFATPFWKVLRAECDSGLLNWVYLIHMDFLYIYLAAELRGKKRWGLAATALLHILLTALRSFAAVPLLTEKVGDWLGFSLLVVAIVPMSARLTHRAAFRYSAGP